MRERRIFVCFLTGLPILEETCSEIIRYSFRKVGKFKSLSFLNYICYYGGILCINQGNPMNKMNLN